VPELTPDAAVNLIADVATEVGPDAVDALAKKILPVTGGNPLFVREIAMQMAVSRGGDHEASHIPVPPTMLAAVSERPGRLSSNTRDVVNAAAALGQDFNLEDVAVVAGCTAASSLASLDEAGSARFIYEVPNLIDRFAFRHACMSASRAHMLHWPRCPARRPESELSQIRLSNLRRIGEPLALSKALLAWLTCTNTTVDPVERLAVITEALRLAEDAGHRSCAARARLIRVGILLQLGRVTEARAEHTRYRAEAESTRVPRHPWHADVAAAALSRMLGRFDEAQTFAEAAPATGQRFGIAEAQMVFSVHMFFVHLHQGRLAELRPAIDAFAALRPDLISWALSAALAASAAGDPEPARHVLRRFTDTLPDLDLAGEFASDELVLAAQLASEVDAGPQVAEQLWSRLVLRRGQFEVFGATTGTLGPVDRTLGLLAAQRDENDEARQLLAAALELCQQMEARVWMVWAGADLATELAITNDRAEARRIAAMVAPTAAELGMKSQHRRLIAAQR
jgi:tetratricopeptide (TPR) repeat protein